jgi:hypothetical protein
MLNIPHVRPFIPILPILVEIALPSKFFVKKNQLRVKTK